jgi:hypothetical protein
VPIANAPLLGVKNGNVAGTKSNIVLKDANDKPDQTSECTLQ